MLELIISTLPLWYTVKLICLGVLFILWLTSHPLYNKIPVIVLVFFMFAPSLVLFYGGLGFILQEPDVFIQVSALGVVVDICIGSITVLYFLYKYLNVLKLKIARKKGLTL